MEAIVSIIVDTFSFSFFLFDNFNWEVSPFLDKNIRTEEEDNKTTHSRMKEKI